MFQTCVIIGIENETWWDDYRELVKIKATTPVSRGGQPASLGGRSSYTFPWER